MKASFLCMSLCLCICVFNVFNIFYYMQFQSKMFASIICQTCISQSTVRTWDELFCVYFLIVSGDIGISACVFHQIISRLSTDVWLGFPATALSKPECPQKERATDCIAVRQKQIFHWDNFYKQAILREFRINVFCLTGFSMSTLLPCSNHHMCHRSSKFPFISTTRCIWLLCLKISLRFNLDASVVCERRRGTLPRKVWHCPIVGHVFGFLTEFRIHLYLHFNACQASLYWSTNNCASQNKMSKRIIIKIIKLLNITLVLNTPPDTGNVLSLKVCLHLGGLFIAVRISTPVGHPRFHPQINVHPKNGN